MPLTPTDSASKIVALEGTLTEDRTSITLYWTYQVTIGDNTMRYVVEQRSIEPDADFDDIGLPTEAEQNSVLALYGYVLP